MHGDNFFLLSSALLITSSNYHCRWISSRSARQIRFSWQLRGTAAFASGTSFRWYFYHTLYNVHRTSYMWYFDTFCKILSSMELNATACVKGCSLAKSTLCSIFKKKRFLAFLSSMWNIQWSILSTYYIYPLDIFVCTYHYMIHWCRSWRKVRSRWKRTTMLLRSSSQSRSWRRKMVSYYFVISFWFDWQQVLKNSTWNGGLGKLHDDVMIIVW